MSHCRRHFERAEAEKAAAAAPATGTMEGATSYELMLAKLQQDRLRLKQVQSNQGKAELKRQLLPDYMPYVEGMLAAGQGAQDEVLTTVMVWMMDAGAYADALLVADYVLRHQLAMPDRFERTPGCLVAEEIATAALQLQKTGGRFDRAVLERTAEITAAHDMPDEARAKLMLALGKSALAEVDEAKPAATDAQWLTQARGHLAAAIELHNNCGGKKDLERVDRLLKKHAASAAD